MFSLQPRWIQLGLTVLFFIFIKLFLSSIILSSFSRIVIDAEFDHQESIEIFYSTENYFEKQQSIQSASFAGGKREAQSIKMNNQVARKLRIDLGGHSGQVKIYGLDLFSYFGKKIHFDPQQIYERFTPNSDITGLSIKDDHLLITSQADDPYLISKEDLSLKSFFFSIIAPSIFSYLFFLLISNFSVRQFPAIYDLNHKTSSIGVNIGSLDGIRGMAALMILAAHTGIQKGTIGSLGVWLFFALSGFLLATPFVQHPEKAVSYSFMSTYLVRRLKRILPMYYTYITLTMLFLNRNPEVFRHYLFLQADGHLWTIPQEMLFYLILPFIMIAIYILGRGNQIASIFLLLLFIYLTNRFLTMDVVALYGYGTMLPSKAGIFLSGVLFSYIYHWLYKNSFFQRLDRRNFRMFCSFTGILLIVALILFSLHIIKTLSFFNGFNYPSIFGFLAGFFILLVLLAGDSLLGRIMSFPPLRAVGLVGFSFYLLHPLLLSLCLNLTQYYFHLKPSAPFLFMVTGISTYFLSTLTYTYIERPFLKKHQSSSTT
jgi:peptidoglycan/LPS O-acetylase OafA/YrhL